MTQQQIDDLRQLISRVGLRAAAAECRTSPECLARLLAGLAVRRGTSELVAWRLSLLAHLQDAR